MKDTEYRTGRTCGDCLFFSPTSTWKDIGYGECRTCSPQIVNLGVDSDGTIRFDTVFPQVNTTMWCGYWEPLVTEDIVDDVTHWATNGGTQKETNDQHAG